MLEVLVAALLIRRLVARGSPLDSLGALQQVARTWWLGDAAAALVVIPFALAWSPPHAHGWARGRAMEAAVLMLAVVAVMSEIAFRSERPLSYLVFPALGWAAMRFGRRGATLAIVVAVGFAVWNTTHYHGPFVFKSITLGVVSTQLYIAVAAVSTLCLAALVSERERFARRLDASRVRLVKVSDTERRRLERNLHDGAQQRLSALSIRLGMAAEHARDAPEPGAATLEAAEAEVILAIDELRELAHGIHPAALTDHGLAFAMRGVALRSTLPVELLELPSARFTGLRDRVEALGGTFRVDSPSGHGTRIAAAIPATPADS